MKEKIAAENVLLKEQLDNAFKIIEEKDKIIEEYENLISAKC